MHLFYQINIPKRNQACYRGGEPLLPGMEYYSLLLDREDQSCSRQDFCTKCWLETNGEIAKGEGFWKSRIEIQESKKTPQPRIERALTLLKELMNHQEKNESELFVLSLFLAHARRLFLRREFEEHGASYALYEIGHQDEFVTIKKVALTDLEIGTLQSALANKLA